MSVMASASKIVLRGVSIVGRLFVCLGIYIYYDSENPKLVAFLKNQKLLKC